MLRVHLEHADREYFGHLAFGGPRVFDWRRGAIFQTWNYDSVCPDPEAKLAASLARKMNSLREQLASAERRAAAAEASGRRAENPIRKQLVVGRATAARAEAARLREEYYKTKAGLKAARAPARRSGKKPTNSPKNLVLDGSSRNCGGAWAKGDARKLFLSSDGTHDGALDLEEAFGRLGIEAHLSSDDDSDDSDDGDASDGEDDSDDGDASDGEDDSDDDASIDAILAEAVQRLRS